jgi:hypothetical protein
VDHAGELGRVGPEDFGPCFAQAFGRRDLRKEPGVHDRELSRHLERVDVEKLEAFGIAQRDRWRWSCDRLGLGNASNAALPLSVEA